LLNKLHHPQLDRFYLLHFWFVSIVYDLLLSLILM
jgi:hypothetical protein